MNTSSHQKLQFEVPSYILGQNSLYYMPVGNGLTARIEVTHSTSDDISLLGTYQHYDILSNHLNAEQAAIWCDSHYRKNYFIVSDDKGRVYKFTPTYSEAETYEGLREQKLGKAYARQRAHEMVKATVQRFVDYLNKKWGLVDVSVELLDKDNQLVAYNSLSGVGDDSGYWQVVTSHLIEKCLAEHNYVLKQEKLLEVIT